MLFTHNDGRYSQYPTSIDHAIEIKHRVYDDLNKCNSCNMSSVKYTTTSECVYCARRNAITFYNFHNDTKHVWTDDDDNHFTQPEFGKKPLIVSNDIWLNMIELSAMVNADSAFTVSPDPCRRYGHYGLNRLGKCWHCLENKATPSPRIAAKIAGEKWYQPIKHCARCGEKALKRVDNGTCSGCITTPEHDQRETADSILMRQEPTMIIAKQDATDIGMKVYRTGKECNRGHTGWRYVSTGTCITCLRG